METKPDASVEVMRERILALPNAAPRDPSPELLDLLQEYWQKMDVDFDTKMEPHKAERIFQIEWSAPILSFRIERHPGEWDRVQRWAYNFDSNEATLSSEWSPPLNPSYTKEQVIEDAKLIVNAMLQGKSHLCVQKKGEYYTIWMGRLQQTKPVLYQLPQRTAKGRQARLKAEVAKLMEVQEGFERVPEQESTGSLVYKPQE